MYEWEETQTQTVALNIDGMTYGGCVGSITRLLEGAEGVEKTEIGLENKNAVVAFDESKTDADALIDAVEGGDYDMVLQPN